MKTVISRDDTRFCQKTAVNEVYSKVEFVGQSTVL